MHLIKRVTTALLGLMLSGTLCAEPILYSVDSGSDSLNIVDPVTGDITKIGFIDGDATTTRNVNRYVTPIALTVRQSDSTIFAWNNSACLGEPDTACTIDNGFVVTGVLLTVNPATGSGSPVDANTPAQGALDAIAYNPADGQLYGTSGTRLYLLDMVTGERSGQLPITLPSRLAGAEFDACGMLYAFELSNRSTQNPGVARIWSVDVNTGDTTEIADTESVTWQSNMLTTGLALTPEGGLLVNVYVDGVSTFYDIDMDSGAFINPRGSGFVTAQGMAYVADSYPRCDNTTVIEAVIDIKPGSDPNCFNNNGKGVIPVALLGSESLDVSQVDIASLSLDGMPVAQKGRHAKWMAHVDEVNGDAWTDLVLQFADVDGTYDQGDGIGTVTGALLDGTAVEGSDAVCVTQ